MKQRKLAIQIAELNLLLNQERDALKSLLTTETDILTQVKDAKKITELRTHETKLEELTQDIDAKRAAIATAEEKISDLEKELDSAQLLGDASKEENRNMNDGVKIKTQSNESNSVKEREAANAWIRSKGEIRLEGLKIDDAKLIIPVDRVTTPKLEKGNDELDLGKLITVVNVKTGSGSHPILKKTKAVLNSVAELEDNPKLSNPDFDDIDYKIDTYRGAIPLSQEAIDDADIDLVALVESHVGRMSTNTDNKLISNQLKSFTKKTITTVDEIKKILNVSLDVAYTKTFILSQSFYQLVDTLKDNEGRYLFQESLTSPSGFTFLGKTVYIALDTQLGAADKANAWVGDLKEAVYKFARKEISARWVDNSVYGQYLQAGKRMQIKKVDTKAGFLITADKLTTGATTQA